MHDTLATYTALDAISAAMLQAAEAGDWDQLITLEASCQQHVHTLRTIDAQPALDAAQRQEKLALLHQILARDRAIRAIIMPWMEQIGQWMRQEHALQKLSDCYDTAP